MMNVQAKRSRSSLDEAVRKVRKYDDKAVVERLKSYGIGENDFRVEVNVYHSEERRGVPYLTLLIDKALPKEAQTELAMDLNRIDSTLCVVFRK
jgi:hypothetical protein